MCFAVNPGDAMKSLHSLLLGLVALSAVPCTAWADLAPPGRRFDQKPPKQQHEGGPTAKRDPEQKPHAREGKPAHAEHDAGAAPSAPDGGPPGRGPYKDAVKELFQELKAGKLSKEELKQKLTQLHATTFERQKNHREDLGKRWGNTLAKAPARDELKVHARRMAFLNRALLLAQSDTAPNKEKTVERITKLIDKENARHDQAMTRIQSQPAQASSAPAP